MNHSKISLDQAPNISTPLRFFITAPLFYLIASFILLYYGPDILQDRWLPQSIALTHSITLGFISMTMIGALFQILPVVAGCKIHKPEIVSKTVHRLLVPGILLLIVGLLLPGNKAHIVAHILLTTGLLYFLTVISTSLVRSTSSLDSVRGLKLAILSLWVSAGIGLTLLLSYAWPIMPLLRHITDLHMTWALLGWVLITIISVAFQVIPMFQITGEYPDYIKKYAPATIFISLFVITIFTAIRNYTDIHTTLLIQGAELFISIIIISFVAISLKLLIQSKKKSRDYSLWFWITGLFNLLFACVIYNFRFITDFNESILIAVMIIAGFISSVITAMLIKIIPFLIWLHIQRHWIKRDNGSNRMPIMSDIISYRKTKYLFLLYILSYLFTLLSLFKADIFFYAAALLWSSFSITLFIVFLQSHSFYRTCTAAPH